MAGDEKMIPITVNGEPREVSANLTVAALLGVLGLKPAGTVVEQNAEILPHGRYACTAVEAGDIFELVRIVGGG